MDNPAGHVHNTAPALKFPIVHSTAPSGAWGRPIAEQSPLVDQLAPIHVD